MESNFDKKQIVKATVRYQNIDLILNNLETITMEYKDSIFS